ncbi:hypothetical protein O1611_g3011 [Lasiodiplodia mahajangana]|uniref:Uncharacterized protein n=1 Tax=Lasiodiplodia mahajangana TaxID=1108764 RepID=A0ACC2JT07_9PEZI|nr:hypothetical protein O1611_g3011 [Lasiodiplodia mahajangana]
MSGVKKRKLATGGASLSAKRTKTSSVPQKSKKKRNRRSVGIDSLPWSKAKLPEMFNDAEGFYGLEEVDGVEVVRGSNNIVEFRAVVSTDSDTDGAKEADDAGEPESEEFEGFDDEPSTTVAEPSTGAPSQEVNPETAETASKPVSQKPEKEPKKKHNKKSNTEEDKELETNVFAGLDAVDEPQDDIDLSKWVKLDLSAGVLSSLAKLKFSEPTEIQAAAIPHILAGHDVIGKASTGSGKTLAFGIPIVERWLELAEDDSPETTTKVPLALILSPTRELAHQLTDHIKNLCNSLASSPYICSITGGLSVQKQQRQLAKADIVIGTPGRLWEVLSSSAETMSSFRGVSYLVIDEADRLLSEGHFKEAEEILNALDRVEVEEGEEDTKLSPRQTLVFSATFHKGLQQKLAGKGKFNLLSQEDSMEYLLKKLNFREEKPKFIDVNPISQMAHGLKEGLVECGAMEKDLYLYALLLLNPKIRTLVFTNSISAARRISPMLQNLNLNSHTLHSQMAQKARLRAIERFTSTPDGQSSVLIATDVAARGLDIPNVDLVIHYHVPRDAAAYVHRSGRTARATRTGLSILLCAPEEVTPTRRLVAKVHNERKVSRKHLFVQTLDVDRKLVSRLKPRVTLAKKIADAGLAKEKGSKDDEWMRNAAEELGVEYDSDELEQASNWGGRGGGRKKKQQEARGTTKAELGAMRAELRDLLSRRVNAGVSEKYIANGLVDVDELLKGANGDFLGRVDALDFSILYRQMLSISKYDCDECGDIRSTLCTASERSSDPECFESEFPKSEGIYGHHLTNISKKRFLEPRDAKCQLCFILSQSRVGTEPANSNPERDHANENPDELRALPFALVSRLVDDLDVIKSPTYALLIGQREAFKPVYELIDRAKNGIAVLSRSRDALSLFSPRIVPEYYDPTLVRGWIQYCQEHHKLVFQPPPQLATVGDQYVALSYVWGKSDTSSDLNTQHSSRSRELPAVLPHVVEDAIKVTLSLGYGYLWVDKLCIDQNDPNTKHDQIQQMDIIYERAELTIIAASGIDQNDSLAGVSTSRTTQIMIKLENAKLSWVVDPQQAIRQSHWSTRGWTFQEAVLARRRLVFTKGQAYFECNAMTCREDLHTDLDSLHVEEKTQVKDVFRAGMFGRKRLFGQMDPRALSVYQLWTHYCACVEDYSRRELTYNTDVLNAFQGIINRFKSQEAKGLKEVLGLSYAMEELDTQSKYLHLSLCWYHNGPNKAERRPQFPSWTWAGWSGEVSFTPYSSLFFDTDLQNLAFEDQFGTRLELCQIGRQNPPPKPAILFLCLEARTIPTNWFTYGWYPEPKVLRIPTEMRTGESWKVSGYDADLYLSERDISNIKLADELKEGRTWRCIYVGWAAGYWLMLLRSTSPGIWSRAGVFVVNGRDAQQFSGDELDRVEYKIG